MINLVERVKRHWLGGVITIAAICISTTWFISNEILGKPRDFIIERQEREIADLKNKIRELQDATGYSPKNETSLPVKSIIILEPTWVYEDRSIQVLSGQILIKVSDANSFIRSATFDIIISEQQTIQWNIVKAGTRRTFSYKGNTYFFDVLQVTDEGAEISVSKQL